MASQPNLNQFAALYAQHRAAEGRGYVGADLLSLPYLRNGPHARQWEVRARSFDHLRRHVLAPQARRVGRPLAVLDLGAGNCWLSYRLALDGHRCTALDIRDDHVDGLGAGDPLVALASGRIERITASFEAVPLTGGDFDIAVFNASLHYALDLQRALAEAYRQLRPGGQLVILDSPFYRRVADGVAMVMEKQRLAAQTFGDRAEALLAPPFIEFFTADELQLASMELGLRWRRRRVAYPLWYEMRSIQAWLGGRRAPSRFDLWVAARP